MKCKGCGCTNQRACAGGCSWFSIAPPVCSACIEAGLVIRADGTLDRSEELVLRATGRKMQCV